MPFHRRTDRHPVVQRFAQACTISLATFVTSGAGLLAFVRDDSRPAWLAALAILSAGMVVASFAGWLISTLALSHRGSFTGAGRS